MMISGSPLPGKPEPSPAPLTYMRHTLRAQLAFWKSLRAPSQVLNWIEFNLVLWEYFTQSALELGSRIRSLVMSMLEPAEQFEFVDSSVSQLPERGVIGI